MKIYAIKIRPIINYCITAIANHLTTQNLIKLYKIKARYLKRILGLHWCSSSTFCHKLTMIKMVGEEMLSVSSLRESVAIDYKEHIKAKTLNSRQVNMKKGLLLQMTNRHKHLGKHGIP